MTPREHQQIFDEAAQYYLGISGEEFARKWDAGEFEDPEQRGVIRVSLLRPGVR